MRQRGIGIFSYSLLLKKDIYSVKDVYNPYIFDPNLASSVFSLNRLNGEIAVSEIDSREFKVHIFNKNYELIKTIIIDLPPIKYAKKTFNGIQEFYDKQCDIMNKQYGKKYEVKKLNKYTRLVKDIAYDKDSNLWVLTPQDKNPDKVRIIIFDKNYKLKGVFHPLLPLGKMYIRNNNLIYFSGIEAEDRKLEIYKIVRK